MAELARRYGIPLVDNYSLIPPDPVYFVDSIHFSPEGMRRLAANFSDLLIPILQEVLSQAEKLVDGASRIKGLFLKVFKESLLEKSEEFTFLDPFAGEFEYREGAIQFTG